MALNIKNQRVVDLAKQCAELTGQTQVTVVEAALNQYLANALKEQSEHSAKSEKLLFEIQTEVQAVGGLVHEELYDEDGLPA